MDWPLKRWEVEGSVERLYEGGQKVKAWRSTCAARPKQTEIFSKASERDLKCGFRERFKVCRERGNTKEQTDSPLKRSEVEGRVERIVPL